MATIRWHPYEVFFMFYYSWINNLSFHYPVPETEIRTILSTTTQEDSLAAPNTWGRWVTYQIIESPIVQNRIRQLRQLMNYPLLLRNASGNKLPGTMPDNGKWRPGFTLLVKPPHLRNADSYGFRWVDFRGWSVSQLHTGEEGTETALSFMWHHFICRPHFWDSVLETWGCMSEFSLCLVHSLVRSPLSLYILWYFDH